jgi:hypothetical protein
MSPNASRAALIRDAALDRVRRTRRWVVVATAGLTAGFAALVSAVAPGRSLASKTPSAGAPSSATASASTGSGIPAMPPPANGGALGLQGPDQAPSTPPEQSQPSQPSQPQSAPSQPTPAPQPTPPPVSGGS